MSKEEKLTGLELLRKPFEPHQISKLPKPTKAQTDAVKQDYKKGTRCQICNGWHHPDVIHLDYVGHAALTDRLLEADINWNWEPMTLGEFGQPLLDQVGGLWIKLTVCGVTRIGYGHPDGKKGGDANKEVIGDALRNAAMRFGAALDLWHKGDLHAIAEGDEKQTDKKADTPKPKAKAKPLSGEEFLMLQNGLKNCTLETLEDEKAKARTAYTRATKEQQATILKFIKDADARLDDIPNFGGANE